MSSKINMFFDKNVAKDVGTDAAIILSNIEFWQEKNKANGRHFFDGFYWTYNSLEAFKELFDYLTVSKIRTCLKNLEDRGYIKSGNYNKIGYDRTKWYTSLNSQKHLSNLANGFDEINEPIPDNKPDNNIYTQEKFLQRWKDARLHYLNKPTHITSLRHHQKERFNTLAKKYGAKEFDLAIKGLFENSTYSQTTLNPNHFLEEFEQYYTAAVSGEKLFESKKEKKESSKKGMI